MKKVCPVCPHRCALEEGAVGFCGARKNLDGEIKCINYGMVTGLSLDPIEKKPLRRFYPGSFILSAGSFGCNLRCPFCQNSDISMAREGDIRCAYISPEALVQKAGELEPRGNIGLAFTYNEPLVGYEFVRDCSALIHERGLKNIVVTNGMICREPFLQLLPLIDAMNIDLKGFTEDFYKKIGGDLKTVKQTIALAAPKTHVEVTTLVVPGENDSEEEMEALAAWLCSVSPGIPLHVSRFFPAYRMLDRDPTSVEKVYALAAVAKKHLQYVYTGNC